MSNRINRRKNTARRRGARGTQTPKTLWTMQPGGHLYEEWCRLAPATTAGSLAESLAKDGRISADTVEFANRLAYYDGIYGKHIPILAAEELDACIREGFMCQLNDEDTTLARRISIDDLASSAPFEEGENVRDCLHRLHAAGLILMDRDGSFALGAPWYLEDRARRVAAGEL